MLGLISIFNVFTNYTKERFKFIPWFIIPLILLFFNFSTSLTLKNLFLLYLYIICQLLFFRLFDDLNMLIYDKEIGKKKHQYFNNIKDLNIILIVLFIIVQIFTYYLYNSTITLISIAFISLCFLLYKLLGNNKSSTLISIKKYFWLSYLVNLEYSYWVLITYALFLFNEVIEEQIIPLNPFFFQLTLIFAIVIKCYLMLRS